jgi:hypothetical protein
VCMVLQPLVRQHRTRGDVKPDQIRGELLAYPYEGLYESCAKLSSKQAGNLYDRSECKELVRLEVLHADPYQRPKDWATA